MSFFLFLHTKEHVVRNYFWIKLLLGIVIILHSCNRSGPAPGKSSREEAATVLEGILENGAGEVLLLEEMGATEYIPIDTVTCDTEGGFRFTFYPEELAFYVLRQKPSGYVTLLIEPEDRITFTGDPSDPRKYQMDGSDGSRVLHELAIHHRETIESLATISRTIREMSGEPDYITMKAELDRKFDSITAGFRDYSLQFIRQHADSPVILVALYNLYGPRLPVFDPQTDLHVYRYVDSVLSPAYAGLEAVELLHAQVSESEQLLNQKSRGDQLMPGKIAPDFVSSKPDGRTLALSELRGNYVLISFWAGWSHLSRVENRYLLRAAERFAGETFRILQVSLDENYEIWTSAIREDGLHWDQVSDLRRWDTPVADLYFLEKIPSNVLVDPEGRITAIDLIGEELLNKLETIFDNSNE